MVNAVMNKENIISKQLMNIFLKDTAINLVYTKCGTTKEYNIICTMYKNLNMWFDNFLVNLEELGFVLRDDKNELYVPPDQFHNILNSDKVCLSLDGNNGQRGGWPEVIFFIQDFHEW